MSKENDKKTLMILLIILGVALIASAFWLYSSFKPADFDSQDSATQDMELARVMRLKEIALENISDFLKLENLGPESIWENFYNNEQYKQLEEVEIIIDIEGDIGNSSPFAANTATTSEEEIIREGGFFGF